MLVEASRTMLIFACALLFLWAEVIATACYIHNHSLIHQRFAKTPYELINGRKLNTYFLHVFGDLCYPKNDHDDIRKLGAKGLDLTYAPSKITSQNPTEHELDLLFEAMYDDYISGQLLDATRTVPTALAIQNLQTPNASTTMTHSTPTTTNSSSQALTIPNTSQDVNELPQQQHVQQQDDQAQLQYETVDDNVNDVLFDDNTFKNPFAPPSISAAETSSSQYVDLSNMHMFHQPY
ncbi:hypothetical protein Tco_1197270 [Tanacetum coccineum]